MLIVLHTLGVAPGRKLSAIRRPHGTPLLTRISGAIPIFGVALAVAATFLVQRALLIPAPLHCVATTPQYLAIGCAFVALVCAVVPERIAPWPKALIVMTLLCIGLGSLWLGSYGRSVAQPLGRLPEVMQGFVLSTPGRTPFLLASGGTAFVTANSTIEVQALSLPGERPYCLWQSTQGGAIDDPTDRGMACQPPAASAHDKIRVLMKSGCGLDTAVRKIRMRILL